MSQQINLLLAAPAKRSFSATSASLIAYAVAAVAVVAIMFAVYEQSRLSSLETQARLVERTLKDTRALHEKILAERKARQPDSGTDTVLADLTAQLKSREEIVEALKSGVVGTTQGFSEYMLALSRQSIPGVWLIGFDIGAGGSELTLSGRALSADLVPTYLQRLTQETPLQGRRFASMLISQLPAGEGEQKGLRKEGRYVEFRISAAPADAAAAPPAQPASPPAAPAPAQKPPAPVPPAKAEVSK